MTVEERTTRAWDLLAEARSDGAGIVEATLAEAHMEMLQALTTAVQELTQEVRNFSAGVTGP